MLKPKTFWIPEEYNNAIRYVIDKVGTYSSEGEFIRVAILQLLKETLGGRIYEALQYRGSDC